MSGNTTPYAGLLAQGVVLVKTANLIGLTGSSPVGVLAGFSGDAATPPDIVWDYAHTTMWICTLSGNATTAQWTEVQLVTGGSFTQLTVTGGTSTQTLGVAGASTLNTLTVSGTAALEGGLAVTGAATVTGNLTVGGTTTLTGPPTLLGGSIYANGQVISAKDNLSVTRTVYVPLTSSNDVIQRIAGGGSYVIETQDGSTNLWQINGAGAIVHVGATGTLRWSATWNPQSSYQTINQLNASIPVTGLTVNVIGTNAFHHVFAFNGGVVGSINTNGSTTAFNTSSDYRLKDVHGPAPDMGEAIDAIPVYDASFKAIPTNRWPMMLAHEVQAQFPWAVSGEKDGLEVQQLDLLSLMGVLWAEVQRLRKRIAILEDGPPAA